MFFKIKGVLGPFLILESIGYSSVRLSFSVKFHSAKSYSTMIFFPDFLDVEVKERQYFIPFVIQLLQHCISLGLKPIACYPLPLP